MKYGIVKLKESGLTSYNLDIFDNGEEIIAFPLEELQTEMLRLKYYLEKSTDKSNDIFKGRVRYKKQELYKVGEELDKAQNTVYSLTKFNLQTSLNDFNWPEVKTKKKRRLPAHRSQMPALAGINEGME
ncbi:MAG: hypothetical protein Q8N97_05265 [Methanobacteriaceae archaeon]|nr:hypothetical protein [Methanobacteriaceae archaeon]